MKFRLLKKLVVANAMVGILMFVPQFSPVTNAEVREYTGVGEYIMSSKETPDFATTNAKIFAQRDASEKAGVFVGSMTEVENHITTKDEIESFSASIQKIKNTNTEVIPLTGDAKGWVKYRVTVTVAIDTDNIDDLVNKYMERRNASMVAETSSLQKLIDERREKVATFEKDLAQKNKSAIKSDMEQLVNSALYNKKLSEASSAGTADAIRLYTEAIEMNPLGAEAYFRRALRLSGQQKIDDLTRAC